MFSILFIFINFAVYTLTFGQLLQSEIKFHKQIFQHKTFSLSNLLSMLSSPFLSFIGLDYATLIYSAQVQTVTCTIFS